MSFEQLQPATPQQASIYLPYIQGNKRHFLPYAMSLYQKGVLEGYRKIEGSNNIPFVATWNVATLPSDLTRCRMQFDGNAQLSYEVMMASFEFIHVLIEIIENYERDTRLSLRSAPKGASAPYACGTATPIGASVNPPGERVTDFPQVFYRKLLRIE